MLCRKEHAKALQAAASAGLAHGPYVAVRVGFEPVPFGRKAPNLPLSLPFEPRPLG